jgi:hypothetical protein
MLEGHFQNANLKFSELVTESYESWIQHGNGPYFFTSIIRQKNHSL